MSIEFRNGRRKINPNQIGKEIEKAAITLARDHLTKKIRSIRDPETGESPKVIVERKNFSKLLFKIKGSPRIIEKVKRLLK